jgi:hypothetical protein
MEIVTVICPFILVKPTSFRHSNGEPYPDNIMVNTNHGPMLAARIEKYQNETGWAGTRTVLLKPEDIDNEPTSDSELATNGGFEPDAGW